MNALIEDVVRIEKELSPAELLAEVRRLGLRTSADSAAIIRADRDRSTAPPPRAVGMCRHPTAA